VVTLGAMTVAKQRSRSISLTRGLLRCGVAAGPLFVGVFVIEGIRRADYKSLRHPVSGLSLGPGGWVQVASFMTTGAFYVAGAVGLLRAPSARANTWLGPALVGAAGVGLLGSAIFATDPVNGYPPEPLESPPGNGTSMTRHGIASIPIVAGLPAAALAYAWRFHQAGAHRWAWYSVGSAATMVASFVAAAAGFGQSSRLVHLAGLFQRASIMTAFAWITAMCHRALSDCTPA
jgi:hypothetical protein